METLSGIWILEPTSDQGCSRELTTVCFPRLGCGRIKISMSVIYKLKQVTEDLRVQVTLHNLQKATESPLLMQQQY